jgi:hypothetical protein
MEVKLSGGQGMIRFRALPETEGVQVLPPQDGWYLSLGDFTLTGMVDGALHAVDPDPGNLGSGPSSPVARGLALLDDWFVLEIIAKEQAADVLVNGRKLLTLTHENGAPPAGVLILANYDAKGSIDFRNIEIKE